MRYRIAKGQRERDVNHESPSGGVLLFLLPGPERISVPEPQMGPVDAGGVKVQRKRARFRGAKATTYKS